MPLNLNLLDKCTTRFRYVEKYILSLLMHRSIYNYTEEVKIKLVNSIVTSKHYPSKYAKLSIGLSYCKHVSSSVMHVSEFQQNSSS